MIPFIDLAAQQKRLRADLEPRFAKILDHGMYIQGPETLELEAELSRRVGGAALGCANGTDALVLALRAFEVGPKDAVFVPDFTFVATVEAVVLVGAVPVFVDVHKDTMNLSAESLEHAILKAKSQGLNPRVVIPVDLFGELADYPAITQIARQHNLKILSDNAQAFGATLKGKPSLHYSDLATTSFFPAKPLGCYGDGGAIFIHPSHEHLTPFLKSIRVHGQGKSKYENIHVGYNSRLDTMQAAVLLSKLTIFEQEIELRQKVADTYRKALQDAFPCQRIHPEARSVYAQFTLLHPKRKEAVETLTQKGIPVQIYYPEAISSQPPYKHYPNPDGTQNAHALAQQAMSLPFHPYLSEESQQFIIESVLSTR